MRPLAFIPVAALALAGCASPEVGARLAPRPAETIDPRVPVERAVPSTPADAALAARLADLIDQARAGAAAFSAAFAEAERLATAAGPAQSESWVTAQQALSAAVAARAPVTRALGDIDALAAGRIAPDATITRGNFEAIQAALREVAGIERRQAEALERLQGRLRG